MLQVGYLLSITFLLNHISKDLNYHCTMIPFGLTHIFKPTSLSAKMSVLIMPVPKTSPPVITSYLLYTAETITDQQFQEATAPLWRICLLISRHFPRRVPLITSQCQLPEHSLISVTTLIKLLRVYWDAVSAGIKRTAYFMPFFDRDEGGSLFDQKGGCKR